MAQVTGKLIATLNPVEGVGSRGAWVRTGIVVETFEDRPRTLAIKFFGDAALEQINSLAPGDMVIVGFSVESRQVGDQWFTDANGYSIVRLEKSVS